MADRLCSVRRIRGLRGLDSAPTPLRWTGLVRQVVLPVLCPREVLFENYVDRRIPLPNSTTKSAQSPIICHEQQPRKDITTFHVSGIIPTYTIRHIKVVYTNANHAMPDVCTVQAEHMPMPIHSHGSSLPPIDLCQKENEQKALAALYHANNPKTKYQSQACT